MKLDKSTKILINLVLILVIVFLLKSIAAVPKNLYAQHNEKYKVIYYEDEKQIGFVGVSAKDMYKTIADHHGIKISSEHAAYIGKEVGKAEIALKLNKNYVQDTELF